MQRGALSVRRSLLFAPVRLFDRLAPNMAPGEPVMQILAILASLALTIVFGIMPAHADKRVALVIGNGAYQHADKLLNPVNDARRMKAALEKLGFTVVFGEDLAKQPLERTIGRFANAAQDADVALVYFAGHGATFGDTPYV